MSGSSSTTAIKAFKAFTPWTLADRQAG